MSVDPDTHPGSRTSELQLWNLYSYCRNNPIAFVDPDGPASFYLSIEKYYSDFNGNVLQGHRGGCKVREELLDIRITLNESGKFSIDVKARAVIVLASPNDPIWSRWDSIIFGLTKGNSERHERKHLSFVEKYVLERLRKLELSLESTEVTGELHAQIWMWIDEAEIESNRVLHSVLAIESWTDFIENIFIRHVE